MNALAERSKQVFLEIIRQPGPDDWHHQVELACGNDRALRERVEALLRAHGGVDSFLHAAPSPVSVASKDATDIFLPLVEQPGQCIGPFKLLQQIGEGGFGVVYMAEQQDPVRRKVALKIIKPGMDTKEVIARFESERQALALMDHPNIARVLDAGATASGRPYFVMELVKGVAVTQFCDHNSLPVKERLEIFCHVCHAVQHAHQKGIIHRDLKPSNVMVTLHDGRPVPKVIDFGVSKAISQRLTEKTLFTAYGQMVGTPAYMSPEQAEMSGLDIDTRTDVYSLGVLLYELLTGTTPFDSRRLRQAGFDEMRRIIREEEPPRPSTRVSTLQAAALSTLSQQRGVDVRRLRQLMSGDLDWIVMKSLEKDRERRYESAAAFARDVQRYMADQPVHACPPSAFYRLRKLARRNKLLLSTAAVVALALIVALVSFGASYIRVSRERNEKAAAVIAKDAALKNETAALRKEQLALAAAREEQQRAQEAAEAQRKAKEEETLQKKIAEAAEADTQAFVDYLVLHVLAAARPKGVQGGLGVDVTVRQALEAAEPKIGDRFAGRPKAEATARDALGKTWRNLGEFARAEAHLRRALELRRVELGVDDMATLDTANSLAVCLSQMGRPTEALALKRENVVLISAKLGSEDEFALKAINNLAAALLNAGRATQALPMLQEIVETSAKKYGWEHHTTMRHMTNLGAAYSDVDQFDEAARIHEQVLAYCSKAIGPNHPETLASMNALGGDYWRLGKVTEAIKLGEQTLKLRRTALGTDHPDTLITMNNLALWYESAGKADVGLKMMQDALQRSTAKLGRDHQETLRMLSNLARMYDTWGEYGKSGLLFQEAVPLHESQLGPEHPRTLGTIARFAVNLLHQHRFNDAERFLRQLLASNEKTRPNHWETFNTKSLLGASLLGLDRLENELSSSAAHENLTAAEQLLLDGYEGMIVREKTIPFSSRHSVTDALQRLVDLYTVQNRRDEAAKWRSKLDTPERAEAFNAAANQFIAMSKQAAAMIAYNQGLAIEPRHAALRIGRGDVFFRRSEFEDAAKDYTAAIESLADGDPTKALIPYSRRAFARCREGRFEDALADFRASYEGWPAQTLVAIERGFRGLDPIQAPFDDQLKSGIFSLLDRYVEDQKRSSDARIRAADMLAELKQLGEAKKHLEHAEAEGFFSYGMFYRLSLLAIQRDDMDEYRRLCRQSAAAVAESSDEELQKSWLTGWSHLYLAPDAVDDYSPLVELMARFLDRRPNDVFCRFCLGAFLYRQGKLKEARLWIEKSFESGINSQGQTAFGRFMLAMIAARENRSEDAKRLLADGERAWKSAGYNNWRFQLVNQTLSREARQTIAKAAENK